jgi:hypothetical protein
VKEIIYSYRGKRGERALSREREGKMMCGQENFETKWVERRARPCGDERGKK